MKKMKKIMLVALCAVAACLMLVGCSGKFVGTWKTVAVEEDGEKVTDDSIKDFIVLEIEKGGEGSIKSLGENQDLEWEADGDTITLTIDGDDADATLEDDQLVLKLTEGVKVYLEKDE
ncbi:MAG: lipocalin family protein [Ruminococcus sp.]|nr:lipocalin family protein [Ruminococcus sp.]